jgi:glutamate dehydrogenase
MRLLDHQQRFIRFLEKEGRLNRAIEFLPSDDEIAERRSKGLALTGPEQSVLLAYSKMWLNDQLLASDLPEDPGSSPRSSATSRPRCASASAATSRAIR